jgi:outer membrane protein OmpA-like peptidoglycan-associated protein
MVSPNRRISLTVVVILAGIMVLSGCATRKYVRLQTQALEPAIQEASNAAKENAERIDAVDRRAQQGVTAAGAAQTAATQAQNAANQAQTAAQAAQRGADSANQAAQQVNTRVNTLETRISNINLSDNYTQAETQTVTFAVNSSTLSNQARQTLDALASKLSGAGFLVELQGFTDSSGSENYNINLSQRRAEAVTRYLVSKNIPLFRISVVGLGEEMPVASNNTSAGRTQNRRVEVKVLRAAGNRATN